MHIGILTDYPVVTFTNGPSLATQALKCYLENRGHTVTIIGPRPGPGEPAAQPGSVLLDAIDFRAHPGVRIPFAWPPAAFSNAPKFDVIHSHANSLLMHWAPMMRELHGIPCLATNTIYLPSFAQHLLPNQIYSFELVRNFWSSLSFTVERSFAKVYNQGDGLIVQCPQLENYWRKMGELRVPLHCIPRPIDERVFDATLGTDPFRKNFKRGFRCITVGRHAREKDLDKVILAFAKYILPKCPDASLTLVGDGMEHQPLITQVRSLGVDHRVDFVGERPHRELRDYYGHADLFLYASMSETYGQVISEALWCGVPVVAADDKMGVASQVESGADGILVADGKDLVRKIGDAAADLLQDAQKRRAFGQDAARRARERVAPVKVHAAYEAAYESAIEHARANPPVRRNIVNPLDWLQLLNDHLVPWTWKHVAMCAIGSFRGAKGYDVAKDLRWDDIDAPIPATATATAAAVAAAASAARAPSTNKTTNAEAAVAPDAAVKPAAKKRKAPAKKADSAAPAK